jgi:Fur family ferric uptake transcriptional regulator
MAGPKRNTWQREAVRARLAEAGGFVSAQQLHAVLREEGSTIGLATVYRNLAQLAEAGEADQLQSLEGENLFRSCRTTNHHHHLICRSCGTAHEIEASVVEQWASRVASEYGFTEIEHVVDLFGICERCRAAK